MKPEEEKNKAEEPQADYSNRVIITTLEALEEMDSCLLYTSPSPRDRTRSRMPYSA